MFLFELCRSNNRRFTITNGYINEEGIWVNKSGGGVICYNGGTVQNSIIVGNFADFGGGVFCHEGGVVRNCIISKNYAEYYGGGVKSVFRGGIVENCTINDNSVGDVNNAGGIRCDDGGLVRNCLIFRNFGSGITCGSSTSHTSLIIVLMAVKSYFNLKSSALHS